MRCTCGGGLSASQRVSRSCCRYRCALTDRPTYRNCRLSARAWVALHSGIRRPLNPAVGDMITSLGWSNQVAVAADNNVRYFFPVSLRPLERFITGQSQPQQELHHNCGLHWHHCGVSKEPAGLPFPMQSQLCSGLLHRQSGWVFVPHGAYRGRCPHRCYCHGWGACVVVTLPLTAWLPSYDANNWSVIEGSNL